MATAHSERNQCAVHAEFSRRLDNRWDEHLEGHDRERSDICKKIDLLFDLHRRLESRINWLLGGMGAGAFAVQILLNYVRGHQP
jgi:hypothetical protein